MRALNIVIRSATRYSASLSGSSRDASGRVKRLRGGKQLCIIGNRQKFDIGQAEIAQRIPGPPARVAPTGHRVELLPAQRLNRRFRLINNWTAWSHVKVAIRPPALCLIKTQPTGGIACEQARSAPLNAAPKRVG